MTSDTFDPDFLLEDVWAALGDGDRLEAIRRLATVVRTGPAAGTVDRLERLIDRLEREKDRALEIGSALRQLVGESQLGSALLESGITSSVGFAAELGRRFVRRFLPDVFQPGDLRAAIHHVFAEPVR